MCIRDRDVGCIAGQDTWLKWQIFIDINNDGTNDYLMSSFVPPHFSYGSTDREHGLLTKYVKPTKAGEQVTVDIPGVIDGPWSKHKVTYKVTDGCHNYEVATDIIEIQDKKAPTPYCVPLSTALMAGLPTARMVELWARDFDKEAFDNCTPRGHLMFTFEGWTKSLGSSYPSGSRQGQLHRNYDHYFDANGWVADVTSTTLSSTNSVRQRYLRGELQIWMQAQKSSGYVYTTTGEKNVRVDVTDEHLNSDWCMTTLKVICNGTGCPGGAGSRIAGTVATESNQAVNNVTVTIDANITEYPVSVTTPSNGTFEKSVPNGIDYDCLLYTSRCV